MEIDEQNGRHFHVCPLAADWANHARQLKESARKIDEMHMSMAALLRNTKHLEELGELKVISSTLLEMKDTTLDVATSKDHIQAKHFELMMKILGTVILVLLFVLAFVLTGQKLGWLGTPH
jgi:hypothetical protein